MQRLSKVLEGVTGDRVIAGNKVEVLRNGREIFPAMLNDIRNATRTVDILTYVYWSGDIAIKMADALSERAQAGVRVRVLLDAVGCLVMDDALVDQMEEAGCLVERFRPPTKRIGAANHRTHRKLLICDEDVAMTGGVGIAEEWDGDARNPDEWRDTHFRITGPAVRPMSSAFVEHWVECGHDPFTDDDTFPDLDPTGDVDLIVLRGSSGPVWHRIGIALHVMVGLAERQICLTTAYFAPGERMLTALCAAADRGVDVQILLPGTNMDKRVVQVAGEKDYEQLLECGVRIFHYEPTMLHAKTMVVDGEAALIGSANIDERSMRHNEEIALVAIDEDLSSTLLDQFAHDLDSAEEIDLERWQDRPLWRKTLEKVVDPISDML